MDLNKGTPKTLMEAIKNAIEFHSNYSDEHNTIDLEDVIHDHVRDFLAQKFGYITMKADDKHCAMIMDLFRKIVRGKPDEEKQD